MTLSQTAWAKVNLTLHILGRRPDGYHELESLVVFAGIGDRLTFAPADDLTLALEGPFAQDLGDSLAGAPDNLILRAAADLRAAHNVTAGAAITLTKNLPVAAGIGGGSADAAAALRGLAELWGRPQAPRDLLPLAAPLGADVPVCLSSRPQFMTGIGEILRPLENLPPAALLLVNPRIGLSTAAVFAARNGAFTPRQDLPAGWPDLDAFAAWLKAQGNDLEAPARALQPLVGAVLDAIAAQPGCRLARMSGSGATCFGLFADLAEAEAAATALQAAQPGWWCAAAPLINGKT